MRIPTFLLIAIVASGLVTQAHAQDSFISQNNLTPEAARQKASELKLEGERLRNEGQQIREEANSITKEAQLRKQEMQEEAKRLRDSGNQLRIEGQELKTEAQRLKEDAKRIRGELSDSITAERERRKLEFESLTPEQKAHLEQLKSERELRATEKQELKIQREGSVDDTREQTQRLQSRNVTAFLKGAQFTLDESTNTVILTTPSGQVHELNHLPDQVVARLMEREALSETDNITELELKPSETGFEYRTTIARKKKFLGLFSRQVQTEVSVDDATGEVSEQQIKSTNIITQALDALSF